MTTYYRKGSICYGNPGTWIHTGSPKEQSDTDTKQAERYDQKASNGQRVSYFVGNADFLERTFRWLSDAILAQFQTFWDNHAGQGKEFYYYEDQPAIYGSAGLFGAAGLVYGGSVAGVLVKMEN